MTRSRWLPNYAEKFKDKLESVTADGGTAIWDALDTAADMLMLFKARHPTTKLRIIVLTDGDDQHSDTGPNVACRKLYNAGIFVDSLVVATDISEDLFTISKHTGGYAFLPSSRLIFHTFLLEGFLSLSA